MSRYNLFMIDFLDIKEIFIVISDFKNPFLVLI